MEQNISNLAAHVRSRLDQLGITPYQLQDRKGPSRPLVNDLLNGTYGAKIGPSTAGKFNDGLKWKPGSAEQCLMGGAPIPLETARSVDELSPEELQALALCKSLAPRVRAHADSLPSSNPERQAAEILADAVEALARGIQSGAGSGETQTGIVPALVRALHESLPEPPRTLGETIWRNMEKGKRKK